VSADGTYTFTSNVPGTYQFNVPVCKPGQTSGCELELLTINVLDPNSSVNPPVASTDIANTLMDTPVSIPTVTNDQASNGGANLDPASIQISTQPANGSVSVNPSTGVITYAPFAGFTCVDTYKYFICDNGSPALCDTAVQEITVISPNAPNSTQAADDYGISFAGMPINGNVLTNDNDPEGNTQNVSPRTDTIAGKGILVINADGSYTFTPYAGFVGQVNIPYQVCDTELTPKTACDSATLYLLVKPFEADPDVNITQVNIPVTGDVSTNDRVPDGTTYGTPSPIGVNPSSDVPVINSDGSYTFTTPTPGTYQFNVPVCPPGQTMNCPLENLTITVLDPLVVNPPVANTDFATTRMGTPVTLATLANDQAGNPGITLNKAITVVDSTNNGTLTVNPTTGEVTYTPKAGFAGVDTLFYSVCYTNSPICDTAMQIITVVSPNTPNTTEAADDYVSTTAGKPVSGSVLTNDKDPEGAWPANPVSPQTDTIPGQGILVLNNDGTYTFTPYDGFSGALNYPYQVCDNGTPQACDSATLYVVVNPFDADPDVNITNVNVPVSGDVSTNDNVPAGTTYKNPVAVSGNPS
ncbi:MAG: Ig-like domain-containing protein, partial [Bacteroidota bacterium]